MLVAIAGGHGNIALRLTRLLLVGGDQVREALGVGRVASGKSSPG
jgi:hypothetical protein